MACICCIFAQVLNIPISWRKTEFGPRVQWIGWQFHITAGYISLPTNKIDKVFDAPILSDLRKILGEIGGTA